MVIKPPPSQLLFGQASEVKSYWISSRISRNPPVRGTKHFASLVSNLFWECRAKQVCTFTLFSTERFEMADVYRMLSSTKILCLDLCAVQVEAVAKFYYLKRCPGGGWDLKPTESQKGSALMEGVHITGESVTDVNLLLDFKGCVS